MKRKKRHVTVTIDPDVKSSSQEVLQKMGVPLSRAVESFLGEVAAQGSFPVTVEGPPSTDPRCRERYLDAKRREEEGFRENSRDGGRHRVSR